MVENPLATIFGFIGSFYGLVIPLLIIFFLTVLFLASLAVQGSTPRLIGDAIYAYCMHAASVLMMTIGALPTVFSVFGGVAYTGRTYVAFLLVFLCGGILFLVQDQAIRTLDSASKAVIEAIYTTSLKIIGNLLALVSGVSLFLHMILSSTQEGWWVTPFVLLLYGLLLSWCTKSGVEWDISSLFTKPSPPVAPARAAIKKAKPKAKRAKKRS